MESMSKASANTAYTMNDQIIQEILGRLNKIEVNEKATEKRLDTMQTSIDDMRGMLDKVYVAIVGDTEKPGIMPEHKQCLLLNAEMRQDITTIKDIVSDVRRAKVIERLDKVEDEVQANKVKLNNYMDTMSTRMSAMTTQTDLNLTNVKQTVATEIANVKTEIVNEISKIKDNGIQKLQAQISAVKSEQKMLAVKLTSAVGIGVFILQYLLDKVFKIGV